MHTDSALDELNDVAPAKESVVAIRDAAERAVALGRQLMTFSQKQMPQTEVFDLNSVVAENHKMLRRLIGEDVKVEFTPGPDLVVKGDRGQLGQIIINLAVNSRDAMPHGGIFKIQTYRIEFDQDVVRQNAAAKPGAYAVLEVQDNGIGMDAETRARLFEPFFTTKGVGKGTGLGLSTVYGMISQMSGFITVESEQGNGAAFRIHLPIAVEGASSVQVDDEESPIRGGNETILLAEDEPALQDKVRQILTAAGYRILAAADGIQALQMSMEHDLPLHLLLSDVVMPEMSGYRLAERLRILRPQTRVLYMSGYPDAGDRSIPLQPEPNLIQKPFTKEELLRAVREALDSHEPGEPRSFSIAPMT
jgi:CheY-like chemotaxis protein